ncbi:MAG: U32 family peptidase [Oscillospiraceae bacterium]|nr:U32 family peptidase [Oscillospiraceae bacterium]
MELLSPAGHWEAMVAAVQNGADAVYLGLESCNARRGAKNFTAQEFPQALDYCHLRGVKVYLTVNTLLTDRELPEAEGLLRQASRLGADGVIVQDWGLAALAREVVPDLPLHASTQMTVHSLAGVEKAAELGMGCAVLGRELSGPDVRHICAHSPISIEVFAHGALCMCWSGQCAMSALIGQRSGNRGLCAQPCRLPYRLDGGKAGHPLSLKDMCLASHVRELRDMGVSLLKLEGRMKRPEYVAVVTRVYAALLKEDRFPTAEERRQLALAFSREGFTDAYWRGEPGPSMFGVRSENGPDPADLFREARGAYIREDLRTVPVALTARIQAGEPARLTVRDLQGHTASAAGPVPEGARTRPLEAAETAARLAKTGGTVYRAASVDVELGEGLSLPASALNALRRDALGALTVRRTARPGPVPLPSPCPRAASLRRLCWIWPRRCSTSRWSGLGNSPSSPLYGTAGRVWSSAPPFPGSAWTGRRGRSSVFWRRPGLWGVPPWRCRTWRRSPWRSGWACRPGGITASTYSTAALWRSWTAGACAAPVSPLSCAGSSCGTWPSPSPARPWCTAASP